ncbi:hypothetical protein SAMN02745120_0117 [Acetoanaerobium noterae]|uniref:Uncharacterized protein n=1 Tax=Acetoanaerobium noterae TaxID=745369 RepID=A0A1T5DRH8_9FIRM|nr:hypothetical protein [Acetoanaerobium noterae]SKB74281.1 hypothetical protein SAMN02745120_0117 [Acetoanaerobium noterae]
MKSIFNIFLIFVFTFFFAVLGGELIRWNNTQEMVYKEIQMATLDAMDLTVDEKLKHDGILYIENPNETRDIIENLLRDNLGVSLTQSRIVNNPHYMKDINITEFTIFQGQYVIEGEKARQIKIPVVTIKGSFNLYPFVARFNTFYFPTNINNQTEFIFRD